MIRHHHVSAAVLGLSVAAAAPSLLAQNLGPLHVDLTLSAGAQMGSYRGGATISDNLTPAAAPSSAGGFSGLGTASVGLSLADALDLHVTFGTMILPPALSRYGVPFIVGGGVTLQPFVGTGRLLVSGDVGAAMVADGGNGANTPATTYAALSLGLRAAYLIRVGDGFGVGPMVEFTRAFVREQATATTESGFLGPMDYLGGGVMVRFGGMRRPAAPAAPAPATPDLDALKDADADGVTDGRDLCPTTPIGTHSDPERLGCPRPSEPARVEPSPALPPAATVTAPATVAAQETVSATLRTQSIAFETDRDAPTESDENRAAVSEVAAFLRAHPEVDLIAVESNANARRGHHDDDELSTARADSVRDALVSAGVARDRIVAVGYGDRCLHGAEPRTIIRVARVRGALAEGAAFGCEAAARHVPAALRPASEGDGEEHAHHRHHHH